MTPEEKQLLLIDLSARLPYGVKINVPHHYEDEDGIITLDAFWLHDIQNGRKEIKPYLRPLSSMTEEEKEELKQEHVKDEKLYAECLTKAANGDNSMRGKVITHFAADWCNKNHFDYRGLIPMGLALEATEGMYKNKNE
jgi:hypothetical protein